jgi:Tol biopolymer transport system component
MLASLSTNGAFVAYGSEATNLDDRGAHGLFVHDLVGGDTTRVDVGESGALDDCGDSVLENGPPAIAAAGRRVAFETCGSAFDPGDPAGTEDVFLADLEAGAVSRVSVPDPAVGIDPPQVDGPSGASQAGGGRIFFASAAQHLTERATDLRRDLYSVVSRDGDRVHFDGPAIPARKGWVSNVSADGRVVAWTEQPEPLFPSPGPNTDVLVHRLDDGSIVRLNVTPDGSRGSGSVWSPVLSGNGRWAAFISDSWDLVPGDLTDDPEVFVRNLDRDETRQIGPGVSASLSANGHVLAYVFDEGSEDVVIVDLEKSTFRYVPIHPYDALDVWTSGPTLSADGAIVAISACVFAERPPVLSCDVWIDEGAGAFPRVPLAPIASSDDEMQRLFLAFYQPDAPRISPDGELIAFATPYPLVLEDNNGVWDIYVSDRRAQSVARVGVAAGGTEGDHDARAPVFSSDGRQIAFTSTSTNLVPGTTLTVPRVFVAPLCP